MKAFYNPDREELHSALPTKFGKVCIAVPVCVSALHRDAAFVMLNILVKINKHMTELVSHISLLL